MLSWSGKLHLLKQVILALGSKDSFSSFSSFQLNTLFFSIWVENDNSLFNRREWAKEG